MALPSTTSAGQSPRDGEQTRLAILEAAEQVFAERGFAGASLRDLADAAGVTRSLIHHHFGSKEDLWLAVADHLFADYGERQSEILARPSLDIAGFEESARALFAFLQEKPNFVRLHAWANASNAVQQPARELALRGTERFREMQKQGLMRDDIDPASALIALFNLVEHWFQARPSLQRRMGDALPTDSAFLEDLVRVLIRGIQPCEPKTELDP
ncbi:MAG: TetR/AcrR family transcriptional regulator [bacterium]|nr:TetR/AcrR family transcriptional regulator [bacterium]